MKMKQHTSTKPGFEGFAIEINDSFEHMGIDTVSFDLFKDGKKVCSVYGEIYLNNYSWEVENFNPIELLDSNDDYHELTVMTTPELIDFVCSMTDAFCSEDKHNETAGEHFDVMAEQGHPSNFL